MPVRKTWLLRVGEIREELAALDAPVVDRSVFERLFRVRRRRAVQLMSFFGGFQAGRTYLLGRVDLMRQLEPIEASAEFEVEERRRRRLIDTLEDVRRHRAAAKVVIPLQPFSGKLAQLPAGVSLAAGALNVEFRGAEDLLSKLYVLAQTAAGDFEAFRKAVDGSSQGPMGARSSRLAG
jgi:hypothetical protein